MNMVTLAAVPGLPKVQVNFFNRSELYDNEI